jgi:quercetin dioxygenase-like cupin family protein
LAANWLRTLLSRIAQAACLLEQGRLDEENRPGGATMDGRKSSKAHASTTVSCLAALVVCAAVLGGCAKTRRSTIGPMTYAPEPMLSVEEWSDDELARDVAQHHFGADPASASGFVFAHARAPGRFQSHRGEVAILVLSDEATMLTAERREHLRSGSVVTVPAGASYRMDGPTDGEAAEILVVARSLSDVGLDEGARQGEDAPVARRVR